MQRMPFDPEPTPDADTPNAGVSARQVSVAAFLAFLFFVVAATFLAQSAEPPHEDGWPSGMAREGAR